MQPKDDKLKSYRILSFYLIMGESLMLQKIDDYHAMKLLGDPRRLEIMQLLMGKPATLSHLGEALDVTPARVRHHLMQLIEAGFVQLVKTRPVRGFTEKYYQATAQAYWVNLTLMPKAPQKGSVVLFGSHDLALEILARWMKSNPATPDLIALPVGSLDGLVALRQGFCQLTGCHLYDPVGGEYNTSYVRHFFPGQPMHVVTLAYREQGLLVAPGNPHGIHGLEDLTREDIRFINRKTGSGTRLWLDQHLASIGADPAHIPGYTTEANTHAQIANAVRQNRADVGLAVYAAARKTGLDFIPLFEERFDLVIPDHYYQSLLLLPALEHLQSAKFRAAVESLGGYDPQEMGKENHLT
jgi:putative molybdopterin biosynthesis protein